MGKPGMPKTIPRNARRNRALWDLRSTVTEEALFALEALARDKDLSRTRYTGRLLEGVLRVLGSVGPLDRRICERVLLEQATQAERKAVANWVLRQALRKPGGR